MSVLRAIAVFLCGFLSLRPGRAQIILPGNCPDMKAMDNFDASRYSGKWYEAEKYFFVFEFGGKCITADYTLRENGVVGVVNKQISILSGTQSEIRGSATQVSRSDEAKLSVSFPSLPINIEAPYWVLDTDYETYSVVWSCYEFGLFHTVNTWILTRERNPPVAVLEKAYSILDKNHISRAFLIRTNQKDCQESIK
ncbi:apolipoprotein D-like [Trichoplusia ni]|uniref:Apolipoprotein D-like n=1 Tax=Trichoplusia ni TaxID=7111 RepID=A0A7E5VUI7_TRINI|nr:apolipoprotein D-like [Trichoplusia ni]